MEVDSPANRTMLCCRRTDRSVTESHVRRKVDRELDFLSSFLSTVAPELPLSPPAAPLPLLIEALTSQRQFIPIDQQLTTVPEAETRRTNARRAPDPARFALCPTWRCKQTNPGTVSKTLANERSCTSLASLIDVHLLLPFNRVTSPGPDGVISHRFAPRLQANFWTSLVIYTGKRARTAGIIIFWTMPITRHRCRATV